MTPPQTPKPLTEKELEARDRTILRKEMQLAVFEEIIWNEQNDTEKYKWKE